MNDNKKDVARVRQSSFSHAWMSHPGPETPEEISISHDVLNSSKEEVAFYHFQARGPPSEGVVRLTAWIINKTNREEKIFSLVRYFLPIFWPQSIFGSR